MNTWILRHLDALRLVGLLCLYVGAGANIAAFFFARRSLRHGLNAMRHARANVIPDFIEALQNTAKTMCPFCAIAGGEVEGKLNFWKPDGEVVLTFEISDVNAEEEHEGKHDVQAPPPVGHQIIQCTAGAIRREANRMFNELMTQQGATCQPQSQPLKSKRTQQVASRALNAVRTSGIGRYWDHIAARFTKSLEHTPKA